MKLFESSQKELGPELRIDWIHHASAGDECHLFQIRFTGFIPGIFIPSNPKMVSHTQAKRAQQYIHMYSQIFYEMGHLHLSRKEQYRNYLAELYLKVLLVQI